MFPLPDCRLLLADSHAVERTALASELRTAGWRVIEAESEERCLDLIASHAIDLVVLDLDLPGVGGIELCRLIRARAPELPLLLSARSRRFEDVRRAMRAGATDFLATPFSPAELEESIARWLGIEKRAGGEPTTSTLSHVRSLIQAAERSPDEMVIVLSRIAETVDAGTGNHLRRISAFSRVLVRELGIEREEGRCIWRSSPLHDIGKIAIPPGILKKPGKLTTEERDAMREHTIRGGEILAGFGFLRTAWEIAVHHHEMWDGNGYPDGLVGDDIPLSARIVAVADVFDALISERSYKPCWTIDEAMEYITERGGSHFDPQVVDAFRGARERVMRICRDLSDGRPRALRSAPSATEFERGQGLPEAS